MKRWILAFFTIILFILPTSLAFAAEETAPAVLAEGTCGANIKWTVDENRVLVISGTGAMPYFQNTSQVPWSNYCSYVQKIIVEDGITSLSRLSFMDFARLTSAELPDSIISIGNSAFSGCSSLTDIRIPSRVSAIPSSCFYRCTELKTVVFPENMTSIGDTAFFCCSKLNHIVFPETLRSIGSIAFQNCDGLTSLRLPDSLTSLSSKAFIYCDNLKEVTLSASLSYLSESCFQECHALESVVLPEPMTGIGSKCFYGCSSLKRLACGENLSSIGTEALEGCDNLSMYVYKGSTAELYALTYGFPCEYIGTASENKIEYAVLEYALQDDGTYAVSGITNRSAANKLIIPAEYEGKRVSGIAPSACAGCGSLVYIELPEGLTWIGSQAFFGCTRLGGIFIPKSVSSIGSRAFAKSSGLSRLAFEDEKYNNIQEYVKSFPISALIGTKYLYNQFKMPGYNLVYRGTMRERPEHDAVIIDSYIDEIIAENNWAQMGSYACIKGVYDWICENVSYAYSVAIPYTSAVGALVNGSASCAGYTEAYKLFMDRLGIECQFIEGKCTGTYGTVSHMWNLVNNGGWYHVDATDTKRGDYSTFYLTDYQLQNVGHTWDESKYPHEYSVSVVAPTCQAQGYTCHSCTTCRDRYYTDYTEKTDHTPATDPYIAPTCAKEGKTEGSHCSVCKLVLKEQTAIPVLSHTWDEGTVTAAPSCRKKGTLTFTCLNCQKTRTEELDMTAHTYGSPVFDWEADYSAASARFTCPVCAHTETVSAAITRLESEETATYTAKTEFNGQLFTDTREVRIKARDLAKTSIADIPPQTFVGWPPKPEVTVTDDSKPLKEGTDYTLQYEKITDAGTTLVTITGIGDYTGTVQKPFTILPRSLEELTVEPISDQKFTGNEITPKIWIRYDSRTLTQDKDYTIDYRDNIQAGTALAVLTGTGNYTGTVTKSFTILPEDKPYLLRKATIGKLPVLEYTGSALTPPVSVQYKNQTLVEGIDYTLSYEKNTNAGNAKITITGIGDFSGTRQCTFQIQKRSLKNCSADEIPDQACTGSSVTPAVTVKDGAKILTEKTDYTVRYSSNQRAGKARVYIAGKGNYKDSIELFFTIKAQPKPEHATGKIHTISNIKYKITQSPDNGNGKVTIVGVKDKKLSSVYTARSVLISGNYFDITEIAKNAFKECKKLCSVNISADITKIGSGAFSGCKKLAYVSISSTKLKSIGSKAFYQCSKLTSITLTTKKLKSVGKNAVKGIAKNAVIHIPPNKKKAYKKIFNKKTGFTKKMNLSK